MIEDDTFEKLWEILFRLFGIIIIFNLLYALFISKIFLWVVICAIPFFMLSGYMGCFGYQNSINKDFKDLNDLENK